MIIHNVKEGEYVEDKEILKDLHEIYNIQDPVQRAVELVPLITEDYRAWNILKDRLTPRQLHLTETAIENNPKSYQAWYHRLYIFRSDPVLILEKITREKQLLELLLGFDPRNFHCWNYKACLMAILRDLINVEGDVSEERLEELRNSGTKIYPSTDGVRVIPHEETIKVLDDHMSDLSNIGKDVSNYSYLHFHGGFDSCAAVFTDPFDEGIWMFFHRKREDFLLKDGFYVRKYRNRLEVHFKESYYGELSIELEGQELFYHVDLPTKIYKIMHISENLSSIKVNGKILSIPSHIPDVALNEMYSSLEVFNESIFLSDSLFKAIRELEPNCLLNFIFNLNFIFTEDILQMLISQDPIRRAYYENIREDLYLTFI